MKIKRILPKDGKIKGLYLDGKLYELLQGFQDAVLNYNNSAVIVVDGRSGLGKTTLANQISITLDKDYDLEKIYYTPESFLIGLASAKKGSCHVFDEAMLISSRSALTATNRMIIQAMSMIRSKNIYVIFCVNSIFDLDKNLALSRADVLLHVYSESMITRGKFTAFFRGLDGIDRLKSLYLNGKKYYSYNKPRSNFFGTFLREFVVDDEVYEATKQKAINEFMTGSEPKMTNASITRDNLIRWNIENGLANVSQIASVCDLSSNTIYTILKKTLEKPHKSNVSRFIK